MFALYSNLRFRKEASAFKLLIRFSHKEINHFNLNVSIVLNGVVLNISFTVFFFSFPYTFTIDNF